jgi:hypothetical protein
MILQGLAARANVHCREIEHRRRTLASRPGSEINSQPGDQSIVVDPEVVAGEKRGLLDRSVGKLEPALVAVDDGAVDVECGHHVGKVPPVEGGDLVPPPIGRPVGSVEDAIQSEERGEGLLAVGGGDFNVAIGSDAGVSYVYASFTEPAAPIRTETRIPSGKVPQ